MTNGISHPLAGPDSVAAFPLVNPYQRAPAQPRYPAGLFFRARGVRQFPSAMPSPSVGVHQARFFVLRFEFNAVLTALAGSNFNRFEAAILMASPV
jgi:hypothetical protein